MSKLTPLIGHSLIELLVVTGLTSFMLAGLLPIYFAFQRTHHQLEKQITETYELHLVETLLRDHIRRAGFTPCMPINSLLNEDGLFAYQLQRRPPHLIATALTLNRMENPMVIKWLDGDRLMLNQGAHIDKTKPYLIADCYHAELIQVKSTHLALDGVRLELVKPLRFDYVAPVYIGEWLNETFYVREKPHPALMVKGVLTEVLTPEVSALLVEEKKERQLLQLSLKMKTAETHQIVAKVRAG